MKTAKGQTLVHLVTDLAGGPSSAQGMVANLMHIGEIVGTSAIYKRYLGPARVDLKSNIEAVLRFHTKCAVDELLWHFKHYTDGKTQKIRLLTYDDLVVMSPQLTLPDSSLHTDLLVIKCASEAWPEYEHPILQKSLRELAATARMTSEAEFYLQGKSLVDF